MQIAPEPTDAALCAAARTSADPHVAFEALMRRYNRLVYRACRAVLRRDADAEDCAQRVWVKVFRRLDGYEGRASFGAWVGRIAYNEAITMTRSTHDADHRPLDEAERVPSGASTPEQEISARQALARIERAVDTLSAPLREVFMLRDIEARPVDEVATMLGLSEENVRVRSHRARTELRRAVENTDVTAAFSFDGERCDRIVRGVLGLLED